MVAINEKHAFDIVAEKIEDEMLLLLKDVTDKTELMQVYNTLATAAIYKYDKERAKEYLEIVIDLTEGNMEYELYTCINIAAVSYIEGNLRVVDTQLKRIMELIRKGRNYYARQQCINTMFDVKKLYDLDEPETKMWEEVKGG